MSSLWSESSPGSSKWRDENSKRLNEKEAQMDAKEKALQILRVIMILTEDCTIEEVIKINEILVSKLKVK